MRSDGIIEFLVIPDPVSTGKKVQVVLVAETDGVVRQDICSLHVTDALPDTTTISLANQAEEILHDFYDWLVGECPDIPAKDSGTWTGAPIRPQLLGGTHYMLFNDDWEIVIWWSFPPPPLQRTVTSIWADWGRIYVRRRFTDQAPWKAAEISSLHNGEIPKAMDPPKDVIR